MCVVICVMLFLYVCPMCTVGGVLAVCCNFVSGLISMLLVFTHTLLLCADGCTVHRCTPSHTVCARAKHLPHAYDSPRDTTHSLHTPHTCTAWNYAHKHDNIHTYTYDIHPRTCAHAWHTCTRTVVHHTHIMSVVFLSHT